jgi:uncharacterized protein (TIGR03437 family)
LTYATFVPGNTQSTSIDVDPAGNAVIAGWSPSPGRCGITKLKPDGSAAIFATQVGTGNGDVCSAVAADLEGNTIVAGSSLGDAFVTKLDAAGSTVYSKRIGGNGRDDGFAVAVDSGGDIYLAGNTASTDFPVTAGAYQNVLGTVCAINTGGGGFIGPGIGIPIYQGAFVVKLDPAGTPLYSTYLGTGCDSARSIALDAAGSVWLAGATNSPQYPQVMAVESGPAGGAQKPVVTMLYSNGAGIGFSSFLNGANVVHVDRFGNIYAGGSAGGHASVAKIQTQYPAPLSIRTVGNAFGRRNGPVSPGQITLITVNGLAPDAPQDLTLSPSGAVPRTLSSTQVLFDGEAAALVSVQPGQIIAVAPYDLAGHRQTTVQIVASGVLSTPMVADVAADRAYLTADGSGTGRALARNPDGTLNSPDNPAPQGNPVTVYATGIGAADPSCAEGSVATTTTGAINGYTSAPGYLCGIFQISFQTPFATGNVGIGNTGLTVVVK